MALARHLPLGQLLTLLSRPLSADDRKQCQAIVRRVIAGPDDMRSAAAEFVHAAANLARLGASETDLRDLLDEEDECRARSHLRNGRSR